MPARRANSFGRDMRLLRAREFARVFAGRRAASAGCLIVYAAPNELGRSRLGLSIGKKAGGSVERNRIKRLLREVFRTAGDRLPAGFDFVVVARKSPCKVSFEEVQSSLPALAGEAANRWEKQ